MADTQKKMRKEEREKKKADKMLKCSTVNNPVRDNSSDVGIDILVATAACLGMKY